MIIIGSARIDENGKISGGKKGDQKQTTAPDYRGEVSLQGFYIHKKGWWILRPIKRKYAEKIGEAMIKACNNKNIGYSQSERYGVIQYGIDSECATNCDCSSLVRACVMWATSIKVPDFNTATEVKTLMNTGLFSKIEYKKDMWLEKGDILVTKTKGHTAIVVKGYEAINHKTIEQIAKEVIQGKWGVGDDRKQRLTLAGYNYLEVQALVNRLLLG